MTVTVTPAERTRTIWVVRDRIRIFGHLDGHDTHILQVEVPPGAGTPPHRHASPELFRIESGTVTFTLFDQTPPQQITAQAGTVVSIGGWVGHNYANTGTGNATMLVIVDGEMVAFFEEAGTEERPVDGPPSDAEIGKVMMACARHGIEIMAGAPA